MTARQLTIIVICLTLAGTIAAPARAYLDAAAAYRMALHYHNPEAGKPRNYNRALLLYCRADRDDHAGAAFGIGLMYAAGQGVRRSDSRAGAWFGRAADLGHEEAKNLLKLFRQSGRRRPAVCPNGWGRGGSAAAPTELKKLVEKMSGRYKLDPKLVLAVIAVESAFQPDAVSSKNAQGLMQLIPATAKRFGVRNAFDPVDNLRGGMAYLRWLLTHFEGDVTLAVAAYNAGENAVKRYGGVPPFAETRSYVNRIRRLYSPARHPF